MIKTAPYVWVTLQSSFFRVYENIDPSPIVAPSFLLNENMIKTAPYVWVTLQSSFFRVYENIDPSPIVAPSKKKILKKYIKKTH